LWLKIKGKNANFEVESSGWPAHLKTPEQKRDFVYAYMTRELLEIDPALIRTNKGLRHIWLGRFILGVVKKTAF
jgi:hypothetical protein